MGEPNVAWTLLGASGEAEIAAIGSEIAVEADQILLPLGASRQVSTWLPAVRWRWRADVVPLPIAGEIPVAI